MTSLSLLFWIVSGILLQLAIYLGIVYWRHWMNYHALPNRMEDLNLTVGRDESPNVEKITVPARLDFRKFRVDRKVMEDACSSICSFFLVPEDGKPLPPFLPGQFLTFRLDLPAATGGTEQVIRCYSLSDAPHPDCYRVSIKREPSPLGSNVPPGRSSNHFHDQVKIGSILQVRAPSGHFHIDRSDDPLVLIGGGIGITPMLSMLNWCLVSQPGREVWLFYGVRNGREVVTKSYLEVLALSHTNFHLRMCFSAPQPEDVAGRDYHHQGRIDINLLCIQLPAKLYHFYICGPTSMLESLVPALEDWKVPDTHIHFEAFGPASIKRRSAKDSVTDAQSEAVANDIFVNFALSGKQLQWPPFAGSLLELAESQGLSVNSGCRAGGCGSCQTKILSGEVAYHQPPDYDPEPGTCLLCVCSPKTSVTLEV
jgi:ferredoxin-NADP reductase